MTNPLNRLFARLFRLNLSNHDDRNTWYLVVELFWASILASVGTFNAAYAIRLGADNIQVSLLSSIPALLAVLVSYPAGQFLQRRPRRAPWVFGSLAIYRTGFLLVALAPALHLFGIQPGLMAVILLVAINAPAHFFNVGWIPMLAEIVPEGRRAALFTARNIINQATLSITVFLCGQWLSAVSFPFNYQVMYVIGFVAAMVSSFCLLKLRVPDSPVTPETAPMQTAASVRGALDALRRLRKDLSDHPLFLRITTNTLMHGIGVWMAAPLYTLYFVRQLHASDAWLGLNGTVASLGTIAGYSLWRYLLSRWGEPLCLKRTIILVGVYPVLVGLTPSLPLILIFGVINGLIVPGVNLAHFNTLLKVTPAEARPRYTAIYITIMNIGAFISPLISVAIADWIGLAPMLAISGLLSVIGSTSFWWRPILQRESPPPPRPAIEPAG